MTERRLAQSLELDIDRCQNTFGVTPCTAGRKESGTAQAGGASTITLRAAASAVDNAYKSMVVRITGGTGPGQERVISGYVGATKVATVATAWTVVPDATSTYDVIDRPNACYNGFRSCASKPNYMPGVQTIRFTGRGAPIPVGTTARPYIIDGGVARAPTKLDPEEGLATRSSTVVTLIDDTGSDVEMDLYVLNRAVPAGGTFWTRFFSRNLNYLGRTARLIQRYVDHGVFGPPTTERFIITGMKGPDIDGNVTVSLKDPTKVLDRIQLPTPNSGRIAVQLEINDMQVTLRAGDGAQYASSGYFCHGDEVIQYDGKSGDVLTWSKSSYRGVFGTAPAVGKVDEQVQQCLGFVDAAFSDVIHTLYNLAGVPDSDLDLAGLAAEDSTWLGVPYRVTALIPKPDDASTYAKELMQQASMMSWWSPTQQQHKFKVYAPASPADLVSKTVDDTGSLIDGSVEIERLDDQRFTLCAVNYGLVNATADVSKATNYRAAEIAIDADAESTNEYGARITKSIFSRWFGTLNKSAMLTLALRSVGRHRDAPQDIKRFNLDPKDNDVVEGSIVAVSTKGSVNLDGTVKTMRVLITSRRDRGTHLECTARITNFDRRYGFIAPAATPDYPNNNGYACVCQPAGLMTDGSSGFLVI